MAQNSKIEWTDASWNPIRGCSRVSEGCRNCYAERQALRGAYDARTTTAGKRVGPGPYNGLVVMGSDGPHWTGKVVLAEEVLDAPLHWKKPKKIFVNSMSDLFHESVPNEWIDRIFAVMALCPQHTFQILTKRAGRMKEYVHAVCSQFGRFLDVAAYMPRQMPPWPLSNVWSGVSVEDQKTADERIPLLLQTPAAVRWVSYGPALGPVDFSHWFRPTICDACFGTGGAHHTCMDPQIDWIVCEGESGLGARPMHPDWARAARDQCVAAGVPFFFKQWGQWGPCGKEVRNCQTDVIKIEGEEWPLSKVGKKAAGRLLDGREWNQFPKAADGFVMQKCSQ